MTLRNSARAGFVAEMVRHVAPPLIQELNRFPLLNLGGTGPSESHGAMQRGLDCQVQFHEIRAHDNQVKEGFGREQYYLHGSESVQSLEANFALDVRFLFA